MGHSYGHLLAHVVFSTKNRQPLIAESARQRLHEYLGGVAREEFGHALEIGGTADHVHGLLLIRPDVAVARAIGQWKSLSSGWIHCTFPEMADFAWQSGYGAFSVSQSNAAQVIHYIQQQPEHHRRRSFQDEFLALLQRHGVGVRSEIRPGLRRFQSPRWGSRKKEKRGMARDPRARARGWSQSPPLGALDHVRSLGPDVVTK